MKRLNRKDERGQGLVEFALILPILLLLILGMFEYGWLLNAKISVNSAAKEAARTLVVAEGSDVDKKSRANTIVTDILGSNYTMLLPGTLPSSGESLVVVIDNRVTPIIGLYVTGEQTIRGSATMRME